MRMVALLRGVTPTGKNHIPSMAGLAHALSEAGFDAVRTYRQSGNLLLETACTPEEAAAGIHDAIRARFGADLSVIIKTQPQLCRAVAENPFQSGPDPSRIHLVFTNDAVDPARIAAVQRTDFGDKRFAAGAECLYLYLPRDAQHKRLFTGYLEVRLGITATTRKLRVVERLCHL